MDQFVAEMVEWSRALDTKFKVNDKDYTFADFCKHFDGASQRHPRPELSCTSSSSARSTAPTTLVCTADLSSLEDIVQYEATQPINEAACGTHRLYGPTWAYHLHLANDRRLAEGGRPAQGNTRPRRSGIGEPDGLFSSDYVSSGPSDAQPTRSRSR